MSTYIGKSIPRVDSLPKALGTARFFDDMALPRMLYARVLRSPYAHARIVSIDTSAAKKLPGVRAVITAEDTLKRKFGLLPRLRDQPMLAFDKVRYVGEEVAAVAADTEDIADEALGLIKVQYEELPAVLDPVEAYKEGSPQVHDHVKRNVSFTASVQRGDVEEALRKCDLVRHNTIRCVQTAHCQIEPYGAVASFEEGKLDVWSPNQSPFTRRRALSNLIGLPLDKIRVRRCYIGGAFGGRSDTFPAEVIAGLLSMKTARPVKITYSRRESLAATRTNHAAVYDIKMGVNRDGTLQALLIKGTLEGGAYLSSGTNATGAPGSAVEALYHAENFKYEGTRMYTNKTPSSMYHIQTTPLVMTVELMLDMFAGELGIDPVEMRLRNITGPNSVTSGGSVISSCLLKECIEKTIELSGWKDKYGKLPPGKGIGMGCGQSASGFPLGIRFGSSAFVKFNEDATATVISGIVDNGQGNENLMFQIAADELGLSLDEVALVNADTELCPQDPGSYSMTATFVSGNAVRLAAQDARQQLLTVASGMMEVSAESLDLKDHRVFLKDDPNKAIPLEDIVRMAFLKGTPPLGRGTYIPKPLSPKGWADIQAGKLYGQYGPTYTFGCAVAEVDVDMDTGKVKVDKLTLVNDVGFPINPMVVQGQMESYSGLVLGHVLLEKHEWDGKGRMLTDGLQSFHLPTSLDMPPISSNLMDGDDPAGPYGAKDTGPTGGVSGAIINAIYNATGVVVDALPVSPETLLKAIKART
ncbi:MAG: molybdopterin-dependent oxidoreductase [Chloroflexi bacterium]|nr:molybdopterin-dependent oxidoreductase [Chloroflexota bacterium]